MALILVIWATALLTVIAASYAYETRTETLLSANLVDRIKAESAAQAGVRRAIVGLLQTGDAAWNENRAIRRVGFGDAELVIAIVSEHGRIDLNAASDTLIRSVASRVMAQRGPDESASADAIADAILDWRDADHTRRPEGAEDGDYRSAGRSYGAADQAFVSVGELALVQGISLPVYRKLKKYFTVHTRASRVDPQAASREVLLAIPGLDPDAVERYVAERDAAGDGAAARVPLDLLAAGAGYLSRTRPSIYAILVEAHLPNGVIARDGVVVRLARSRQSPYLVLARIHQSDDAFEVLDDVNAMQTKP